MRHSASNINCIYQACISLWYGFRCYAIYISRSKQRQHIGGFYVISIPGCCKFHANGQIEPSKDYTTWWGKTGGSQRRRDVRTIAGMGSQVSVGQCNLKVTIMTSSNGIHRSPPRGFPSQRSVTRSFDVFFDLCLNKRLSKQSRCLLFETPSHSLWRNCDENPVFSIDCLKKAV